MTQLRTSPITQDDPLEELIPYEQSIGAILIKAKEAVIAPIRFKLRDEKITEPQWRVMRVLNDRGTADAASLAEICNLHPPSVSRILRMLVSQKYVARRADLKDGRRTMVALTQVGREIVQANLRDVSQIIRSYSEQFGADRLDRLIGELEALYTTIAEN